MKSIWSLLFLACSSLQAQKFPAVGEFLRLNVKDRTGLIEQYMAEKANLEDSLAFYQWLSPLMTQTDNAEYRSTHLELQCAEAQFMFSRKNAARALAQLQQVVTQAEQQKNKMAEANARHQLGVIYLRTFKYKESVAYLLKANAIYEEIGWDKVVNPQLKLAELGELMQVLYTQDLGLSYFKEAGNLVKDSLKKENFRLFLLTGFCYRAQKDTLNTRRCFQQCLKIGQVNNDKEMIATASGEIGAEYFIQKKYEQAERYMIADYQNSIELGRLAGASNALGVLGFFDALRGNKREALHKIRESEKLCTEAAEADRLFHNCEFGVNVYVDIYTMLGDTISANHYKRQFMNLMEQKKRLRNDSIRLIEVEAKAEAERYLRQFNSLKETRKVELRNRNFWLIGLSLAAIIGFYIFYRERKRRVSDKSRFKEQEAQMLEEQLRTEEELHKARQALDDFTQRIRDRNQGSADVETDDSAQKGEHSVEEQLSELTILTDEEWLEFKQLFEQAHPDFFEQLERRYPTLTPAENRLLALTKLDLSQRDMGAMLGVSPESVRKTRQRLRKKIDIREDELLNDWLKRALD